MNSRSQHGVTNKKSPVLEVSSLSKSYGNFVALSNVSLSVFVSQVFCLVGPNGAGKTTLINCILGLTNSYRGDVRLLGYDTRDKNQRKKNLLSIGVQFQHDSMYSDIRVEEALKLYASMYDNPLDISELLSLFSIDHLRRKTYSKLSGGEKRKLLIAITLVGNPKLVFLDEPTSNLDPHSRKELWEVLRHLRDKGLTIFLSTHNMEEAQRQSDVICLIDSGKIIATGDIESLLEKFQLSHKFMINADNDLEYLNDIPSVTRVVKDSSLTLIFGHGNTFTESILDELQNKRISEYTFGPATLEDLYLLITGKSSIISERDTLPDS